MSRAEISAQARAEFAERLRVALAKKRWKAAQLARALGVSRQLVGSWTRGEAIPSGASAIKLPDLLGVAVQDLFPMAAKTPGGERRTAQASRSPGGPPQGPPLASGPFQRHSAVRLADPPSKSAARRPEGGDTTLRLDPEDVRLAQHAMNQLLQALVLENEIDRQVDGLVGLIEFLEQMARVARRAGWDATIIEREIDRLWAKRRGEPVP